MGRFRVLSFITKARILLSMNGTKTRRHGFGVSWWIGLGLFVALIGFMAFDILQREGGFGKSDDVLVMGTNAGFKPFEYKQGD